MHDGLAVAQREQYRISRDNKVPAKGRRQMTGCGMVADG